MRQGGDKQELMELLLNTEGVFPIFGEGFNLTLENILLCPLSMICPTQPSRRDEDKQASTQTHTCGVGRGCVSLEDAQLPEKANKDFTQA